MRTGLTSKIDGVIFDLGSTLLEYETIPWDELSLQSVESGYAFLKDREFKMPSLGDFTAYYLDIRDRYREYSARTLKEWIITDAAIDLMCKCGINADQRLVEDFLEAYSQPLVRQVTMFADVPIVLRGLKSAGIKIGLVSNTIYPAEFHRNELKNYDIFDLFDFTVFSSEFGYRKPHRSIYQEAVDLIQIAPEHLLFVGDRYIEDYHGPVEFGMNAIIRYREGREYPEPLPDELIMIQSLSELLAILSVKIADKCK